MTAITYLADTNILIRLTDKSHPDYPLVGNAVDILDIKGVRLAYTLQNRTELWNVFTPPLSRNGFGLSIEEAENSAQLIEEDFDLLLDNQTVYDEWRRIVFSYHVSGVQVHDTRLAACMYAHKVTHILTFNTSDFARYHGLTAIHPTQATAPVPEDQEAQP